MLTNASLQKLHTSVMLMLIVSIPLDHTIAPVNHDTLEMDLTVNVSLVQIHLLQLLS